MSRLPAVQLVVNPLAGNGRALVLAEHLESSLRARGRDVRELVVRDPGEARRWLERGRGDFGFLVCVGGDTTLSEVAPVALELRVPLVPVPAGFGNVFARTFGHQARVPFVLHLLERGAVRWVDVGVSGEEIFLCSQSFGFLEEVKRAVESRAVVPRSRLLRYLAYVHIALGMLRTAPLPSVRVEVDGKPIVDDAAMAIVANVPTYRGFLTFTPEATPFDGLLDVFAVPPLTKRALVFLLLAHLVHLPPRGVVHRRANRASLEVSGRETERLGILPRALPVLVPRERSRHRERA